MPQQLPRCSISILQTHRQLLVYMCHSWMVASKWLAVLWQHAIRELLVRTALGPWHLFVAKMGQLLTHMYDDSLKFGIGVTIWVRVVTSQKVSR